MLCFLTLSLSLHLRHTHSFVHSHVQGQTFVSSASGHLMQVKHVNITKTSQAACREGAEQRGRSKGGQKKGPMRGVEKVKDGERTKRNKIIINNRKHAEHTSCAFSPAPSGPPHQILLIFSFSSSWSTLDYSSHNALLELLHREELHCI